MSKDRFQKLLEENPDPEYGDLNEFERLHLTPPTKGPYQVDDRILEALDLDFFSTTFINKTIFKFQKQVIPKIGLKKYNAIELALAAYTASATTKRDQLLILKKLILNLDIEFQNALDRGQRLLYLEKHAKELIGLDLKGAIYTTEDLKVYMEIAEKIVYGSLNKHAKYLSKVRPLSKLATADDILIFRGFNNLQYYRKRYNERSDFLSLYASASHFEEYYEPNILNSYSLCNVVAERFMVAKKSQRRVLITAKYDVIKGRILSSFLNSPVFVKNQLEILTIPSVESLVITEEMNDPNICARFRID